MLHTVNSARQSSAGTQGVCRVLFFGHTAKSLPFVLSGPRQNKITPSTQHATWVVCRVPHGQAHGKQCHICRVPRGSFAVCLAMAHGKKWWHTAKLIFRFFFYLITNISDSNQINITGNSYIFASNVTIISYIAMHTSPNVVDTSPYKHW